MDRSQKVVRPRRRSEARRAYELIVRGPDGRPRFERFADARAYRARLRQLKSSTLGVSIDEIAALLDA